MTTAREMYEKWRSGMSEEELQTQILLHIAEVLESIDSKLEVDEYKSFWVRVVNIDE